MAVVGPVERYKVRRVRVKRPQHAARRQLGPALFTYDGTTARLDAYRGTDVLAEGEVASIVEGGCGCGGKRGWTVVLASGEQWMLQG